MLFMVLNIDILIKYKCATSKLLFIPTLKYFNTYLSTLAFKFIIAILMKYSYDSYIVTKGEN